jgi:tetratricopeptide (TPR) repeat protein
VTAVAAGGDRGGRRLRLALAAAVALLSCVVYAQLRGHSFIGLDDTRTIVGNRQVRAGITAAGVRWAFALTHPPYWDPLTTLSHMLDVELFGLRAGGHLLMNAALHTIASILLLLALGRATGQWWPSGVVAALFAVHPLHVESVAWATERRDVLSGVFWMLALAAWVRFARRPGTARYAAVVALFGGALLAKPMAITLPAALLVLDGWPLGRLDSRSAGARLLEKLPLALAALPVALLAWLFVRRTTAAAFAIAPGERIANALVSLATYPRLALWPRGLAIFYPHPASLGRGVPTAAWAAALAAVGAATLLCWRLRSRRPWLLAGWSWYLVTVAPVIGVVQNWEEARADRFMYVPLVGLLAAAVWEGRWWFMHRPALRAPVALGTAAVLVAATVAAREQAATWRSPETLFRRALAVTEDNWLASAQLGTVLMRQGRLAEAEGLLREALRLRPAYSVAHSNLGAVLDRTGRPEEAAREYAEALRHDPGNVEALVNLGTARFRAGAMEEAEALYRRALDLDPLHEAARYDLELLRRAREAAKAAGR